MSLWALAIKIYLVISLGGIYSQSYPIRTIRDVLAIHNLHTRHMKPETKTFRQTPSPDLRGAQGWRMCLLVAVRWRNV